VGGGIGERDRPVVRLPDDRAVQDDDSADRHLPCREGLPGLGDGF
jgi:hypothetical protein